MASKISTEYYPDLKKMSRLRAIALSLINSRNEDRKIERNMTPERSYEIARKLPQVTVTDLPIYEGARKRLGLAPGAMVLEDAHGAVVGRTAKARVFYNRQDGVTRKKIENICLDAVFEMQHHKLLVSEAVLGLHRDLMIKATLCTTESNASNVFNWLVNFAWFDSLREEYGKSKKLPIQDVLFISYPEWKNTSYPEFGNLMAIFDADENIVYNLGMRYFGELKKGTLTLAWTSGMRMGQVACHGGIKEVDFTKSKDPRYHIHGKKVIGFFGLSGSGKSSHTNAKDNGGSLPKGTKPTILHDDAFQIDVENKACRVWEPSLFDKMDSRGPGHPDWKYVISTQNNGLIEKDGKVVPLGLDIRNGNSRALLDRDLLGNYTNKIGYPDYINWLMKDSTLPPVLWCKDVELGVAMGATLMTKRTSAENVSLAEMNKLVFEPYANPFRVYELYKDVAGFTKVFQEGTKCFVFNSGGFWESSDTDLQNIPLKLSLRLQTAILMEELEWEEWNILKGAYIPKPGSIDKIYPDYSKIYSTDDVTNREKYIETLKNRFQQRKDYLINSDLKEKPELLERLLKALENLQV